MANKTATNSYITAQAPSWAYATDPDHGDVYCLCCHTGTDPQQAFEQPGKQNHKADCNAVALIKQIDAAYALIQHVRLQGPSAVSFVNLDGVMFGLEAALDGAGVQS